ncbi:RNA polymerase sigma factor [Luteolibacter algae]|uniref:RNA polymerase sigma factor n=1 Tax=Luteolibacter algae TaxID=454151 RepID=A0ABW5D9L6_9BACT
MSAIEAQTQSSPATTAWRAWLEEHAPKLFLFARNQTRSHEDAQDVLQDAIVKLVEKIRAGEFVGGQEAWQPYLYTTIRRLAIDLSRKDDRRKKREDNVSAEIEAEQLEAFHPWFDSDGGDEETKNQLEDAIKSLPEKFSEVIVMKIWGEQTFAQIGEALGISQNTAASRYRYGLDALKRELGTARIRGDLSI